MTKRRHAIEEGSLVNKPNKYVNHAKYLGELIPLIILLLMEGIFNYKNGNHFTSCWNERKKQQK